MRARRGASAGLIAGAAGIVLLSAVGVAGIGVQPAGTSTEGIDDLGSGMMSTDVIAMGSATPRMMYLAADAGLSRTGFSSPGQPFTVAEVTLPTGRYALGYELDVAFAGAFGADSTLTCALVEAQSGIAIQPQAAATFVSGAGSTPAAFRERVDLPGMTVAVQCRPDRAGLSRTDIAVVTVFAIELR